jgi:hypothetical protein
LLPNDDFREKKLATYLTDQAELAALQRMSFGDGSDGYSAASQRETNVSSPK